MFARSGGSTACLPRNYYHVCDAQLRNSYTIDPEGNIYKCLNDASIPNKKIGNVDSYDKLTNECKYSSKPPFLDETCSNCNILPLCYGGCPEKRAKETPSLYMCSSNKYNLKQKMKLAFNREIV